MSGDEADKGFPIILINGKVCAHLRRQASNIAKLSYKTMNKKEWF